MESRMDNSDSTSEPRRLPADPGPEAERAADWTQEDWAQDQDSAWNEFPEDWDPTAESVPAPPVVAENERLVAMLCYVSLIFLPFIFPIIVLLSPKRTLFQTFHAAQSLGLGLCCGIFWIGLSLVSIASMVVIPVLGAFMGAALLCLLPLTWLLAVMLVLLYAYRSFQGQYAVVPGLYEFMRGHDWIPDPDS